MTADSGVIEQWDRVDNTIIDLIVELNPSLSREINAETTGVAEAKADIREILIRLYCNELKLCAEDEFYP